MHTYGTPWYGSDAGKLPAGVKAVALAADPATGVYWILRFDCRVASNNAPWYGSMAGQTVTGITGE